MAVGRAGAKNAAVLAAQILALKDPTLREKVVAYKEELAEGVWKKADALQAGTLGRGEKGEER